MIKKGWPEIVLEKQQDGNYHPVKVVTEDGTIKKEPVRLKPKDPESSFIVWVASMSDNQLESAIVIAKDNRIWEDNISDEKYEILLTVRANRLFNAQILDEMVENI